MCDFTAVLDETPCEMVGICVGACFAGLCTEVTEEICNGEDDDCDNEIDEDFLVDGVYATLHHCGACDVDCEGLFENATAFCDAMDPEAVECKLESCNPGYWQDADNSCVVPPVVTCVECVTDVDCLLGACVELVEATYCLDPCYGGECQEGFSCGTEGDTLDLCVPESGTCSCTSVNAGETRPCEVTNELGTCIGEETCDAILGWMDCDAPVPTEEICNDADDDCDGDVDEGYPDTDQDGLNDCLDDDDDDDLIPDDDDCAPLDVGLPDCLEKDCGDDGCGGSCGTCEAEQYCQDGQCHAWVCTPSEISCDAGVAMLCNADGSGSSVSEVCAASEVTVVDTVLSSSTVEAGATSWVTCAFTDSWGIPAGASPKVVVDPQIGLQVAGIKIVAKKSGTYQVACMDPLSGTVDQTPAILTVTAGPPKKIVTALTLESIQAGQFTTVSCEAQDALGNTLDTGDFGITVFVSSGLDINGFDITGTQVGVYQVICVPQEDPWDDSVLTPRTLTINHGAATGVNLVRVPDKPIYKMFEMVTFFVSAVDDYGNPADGVPMTDLTVLPSDPGIEEVAPMTFRLGMEGQWNFTICLQDNQSVCDTETIPVDGYGPVINIKCPARGSTLMDDPTVVVTGTVFDPVSGIAAFRINDDDVYVDGEGNFSYPILSKQGMNLIVAVAEDPNGFKTLLAQSYYYSPIWYSMNLNDPDAGRVQNAVMFFIWDQFFEDSDSSPPPNDISSLIELTVQDLDLGSFIPNPVAESGPYSVSLGNVNDNQPEVSVTIDDDLVYAQVNIWGTSIPIEATGSCNGLFIGLCPDVSGEVEIDTIEFLFEMDLSLVNNEIAAQVVQSQVVVEGIDVSIDGIIGWPVGWIVDWAVTEYSNMLNDMVQEMIDEQIQNLVVGFLGQLDLSQQLEIPNPLNPVAPPMTPCLDTVLQDLHLDMTGAYAQLAGTVLAGKNINKNPLGSIGRASCLALTEEIFGWDPNQFAQIGVHDDLINQILFAAWWGGLLDMVVPLDQIVDPSTLELLGIGSLEDLGITDIEATTEFFLPPIITSCNDFDELKLEVGDIYVELNMKMLNEPVTIGVFASLAAAAEINIEQLPNGSHEFGLGIGEIDPLVVQVTYISDNLAGAEGFMMMLVQAILLPTLLEGLTEGALASFALPELNISELSDMLPPNWVMKFVVDDFYRVDGYTTIEANITSAQ